MEKCHVTNLTCPGQPVIFLSECNQYFHGSLCWIEGYLGLYKSLTYTGQVTLGSVTSCHLSTHWKKQNFKILPKSCQRSYNLIEQKTLKGYLVLLAGEKSKCLIDPFPTKLPLLFRRPPTRKVQERFSQPLMGGVRKCKAHGRGVYM